MKKRGFKPVTFLACVLVFALLEAGTAKAEAGSLVRIGQEMVIEDESTPLAMADHCKCHYVILLTALIYGGVVVVRSIALKGDSEESSENRKLTGGNYYVRKDE